ncbi:ATP-binding protein [Crenobacter cavernae]|uniref:histidine kinase n=1 Tax=Crenobacter cavernae TaxID=2290923 RepID=A0ABY0FF78_9NEIS|nr:ATP-binding protein [Crenobacter cavernae]RXZ44769.1 hypothetical protein EBB06_02405 [Crenobacter cavernae]
MLMLSVGRPARAGGARDEPLRILLVEDDALIGDGLQVGLGRLGFVDETVKGRRWRLFFLASPGGSLVVAVGQPYDFRDDALLEVLANQLLPWLLTLPILLLLIVVAVNRWLAPLSKLAEQLSHRQPHDSRPLATEVPSEARPLVDELNRLFSRVAETLGRERRFTTDAAHELRTPLSALRVQAEVATLAHDEATRTRALSKLMSGIDRATRLTEQLLALSRLDPLHGLARADALLIALLLRNLLDNALRYGREGGVVELILSPEAIVVRDDGPGVPPEYLERVRERFFRPPGQEATGSGLGLSIVERIAELHSLALTLANRPEGGFMATLARCDILSHSAARH